MLSNTSETPDHGRRSRFVTLCQQMLALAVVVAVLTPAARTISMDVRPPGGGAVPVDINLRSAEFPSVVPTEAVEAEVEEFAITTPVKAPRAARKSLHGTARPATGGGRSIVSEPLPVDGYGTVGVTWSPGAQVEDDAIEVQVRSRIDGDWTGWTAVDYHDEHAPDPTTEEGRNARPGTDALLVGDVEAVQVKVDTEAAAPADMKVAVIDPGQAKATATQGPAIDTGRVVSRDGATGDVPAAPEADPGTEGDDLAMQAGTYTPKPQIYSRAQWGANEKWREKKSLSYYEVHGGYVHHTVNANNYSQAEVPGIIRGIYSYHTRSRGWSDVGYNFLVDKFGRIWEGRAGGVDRPVVGAHTSGYNQHSFALSAIGNFETARPTSAMLNAYGALFAWKLSLHGVDAADTSQKIGSRYFPAISGHRDAGSTACPGRYLYAQIPTIRSLAKKGQRSWSGRQIASHYVGTGAPDILTRRARNGRVIIQALAVVDGRWKVYARVKTNLRLAHASTILKAGDWDRDGHNDILVKRRSNGAIELHRGMGAGRFHAATVLSNALANTTLLAAPGDVTGDGYPDLMAQNPAGGMRIYPGRGTSGLASSYRAYSSVPGSTHVPVGLMDKDGAPDSIVRSGPKVRIYYGNGPGGWTSQKTLEVSARGYDRLIGIGRLGSNRRPDFVARVRKTGQLYVLPGRASGWKGSIPLGNFKNYDLFA